MFLNQITRPTLPAKIATKTKEEHIGEIKKNNMEDKNFDRNF
jgi:hypothetical protein